MLKARVEFWFEFASTYSHLSVMRLPDLAQARGIEVIWRPFLLGPIFAAQGWNTSPFKIYPAKGAYMWRDMARRAAAQGLSFHKPEIFPQNGLHAARLAQCALRTDRGVAFCQAVYQAQFAQGQDISQEQTLLDCLNATGLPAAMLDDAQDQANKDHLRKTTEEAAERGIFGAPSITVDGELFWGDDRLEEALDWACMPQEARA